MKKIASLLQSTLNKYNLEDASKAAHSIYIFHVVCRNLLGETATDNIKAYKCDKGILFVKTKNAAWSQQLQLVKSDLLHQLQEHSEIGKIQDIRIRQS